MTMKRRRIVVVYVTLASFLVVSMVYLVSPPQLKLRYVLNNLHLSRVNPQHVLDAPGFVCPLCGSMLDRIVLDPYDPQVIDEAWRFAYYCSREDVFWVLSFSGGMSSAQWYGPFNAYWKLTNAIAVFILVVCGATVFLLAVRSSIVRFDDKPIIAQNRIGQHWFGM